VDDGKLVVYSPNMNYVWYPPIGENRTMKIRSDGRYADDDFLCWPQMYNEKRPHLPFILRRPSTAGHSLDIIWWTPSLDSYVVSAQDVLTGVGLLNSLWIDQLRSAIDALKARHKIYERSTRGASVTPLVVELEDALARLELLPGTFSQVQFAVAHLQRVFLELTAWLDYSFIYYPMMIGTALPATSFANVVGIFIKPGPAVQQYLRAGVPLWIVHTSKKLPHTRIDALVNPRCAHEYVPVADASPPFPPFFTGLSTSEDKHTAYARFAHRFMGLANPLEMNSVDSNIQVPLSSTARVHSSTNAPAPATSRGMKGKRPCEFKLAHFLPYLIVLRSFTDPNHKPNQKQHDAVSFPGRNKFEELQHCLLPPVMPSWGNSLQTVNRNSALRSTDSPYMGYVFPDPALFVSVQNEQKTITYLKNWLRYRPAFIYRVSSATSSARPLSTQTWRTFLFSASFTENKNSTDSAFQKRRNEIMDILEGCLHGDGVGINVDPLTEADFKFCDATVSLNPPLDQWAVQPIFWELYELNFRFELLALDAHLTRTQNKTPQSRQQLIKKCFPGRSLLVPDINHSMNGLTATNWKYRIPYLLAFWKVLKTWADCPEALKNIVPKGEGDYAEEEILTLERQLAQFYTQSFFNTFGRAAVVPHRLNEG
jgi:hypothetical protein